MWGRFKREEHKLTLDTEQRLGVLYDVHCPTVREIIQCNIQSPIIRILVGYSDTESDNTDTIR